MKEGGFRLSFPWTCDICLGDADLTAETLLRFVGGIDVEGIVTRDDDLDLLVLVGVRLVEVDA